MESFSITAYNDPDWLSFINNHPESHFFHHPVWSGFLAHCYGYHPFLALVRDSYGQITAGLPLMEISNFGNRRRWVSLPFTDHCPPLFLSRDSLETLVRGITEESRGQDVQDLELRWEYASSELFQSSEYILTTTKLSPDPSLVRDKISGSNFRKVKLGSKRGITIEKAASLDAMRIFYKLHLETRRRLGVPVQPWRFFQLLCEEVIEPGNGFISLARKNDEYLAGIVFLHWNKTLVYKFSASSSHGKQLAASYPITWDAIQWGCENSYSMLDWGRSDSGDEGLRDFKKHWASEENSLTYSRNKEETSSLMQKARPFVNSFISRSPLWVCRLSGEILYRYFG
ncbi:MAG: lipid II:glycine glycyltransferase FemX [Anaerolineaceae bacterium]